MFSKTLFVQLIAAAALSSAAPTPADITIPSEPSRTVSQTGVTHTVVAGRGGLKFDPENVVAEVGDVVEWHFLPANHSVVQSSFGEPCQPSSETSFFSGFFPTTEGQNPEVFQIVVEDSKPIWYYCAQTKGNHCQRGMVGVVNQFFDSPDFTLDAHKALAADADVSIAQADIQGGERIINPNPLSGV